MRRFSVAAIAIALHGAAGAAPVLSPRVRMVAHGQLEAAAIGDPAAPRDARALVTVRAQGGAAWLRANGFDARALTPTLAQVRVTAAELARLASSDGVSLIEERRLLYPTLDQSTAAVGAPAARAELGLDGRGVLVGVVDTGADFRHADLRNLDGTTRIAALLDLATPRDGRHPELPDFGGAVWLADEIDADLAAEAAGQTPAVPVVEHDTNGHGTHVAGIAVANGLATGNGLPAGRYIGMAPAASLVVAQATHGGSTFTDGDVLSSCGFVLNIAGARGEPIVVNLSLGGAGGPHDGESALELGLDELFPIDAPGRALVVAAGNDGAHDLHAGAWQIAGETIFPVALGSSLGNGGALSVEIWYRGALTIVVEAPDGHRFAPVAPGLSFTDKSDASAVVTVDNASGAALPSGLVGAGVVVAGANGRALPSGTWKLHLAGSAERADAWIIQSPPSSSPARFIDHVDVDARLSQPATAHNVIGVGSFVTKSSWVDFMGQTITRPTTNGDLSSFSSGGPTTDGRFAPDLIAPGEFIASALSIDAQPNLPTSAFFAGTGQPALGWADDGVHGLLRGTSQATPHVSGAIALLLQLRPDLSAAALREILRVTAADDALGYTPRRGFGRLDVPAAARYVAGARGGAVDPARSTVSVSRDQVPPGDELSIVTVTPRDAAGTPLGPGHRVTIATSAGAPIGAVADLGWGRYEQPIAAHATLGAVGTVSVTVDGVALAAQPSIFFVADRSQIGRPFVASGGCSAGSARAAAGPAALALLAALAFAVRWNSRRSRRRSNLGA